MQCECENPQIRFIDRDVYPRGEMVIHYECEKCGGSLKVKEALKSSKSMKKYSKAILRVLK